MSRYDLQSKVRLSDGSGFTLVEFIVIMTIFAVMIGVVLFNFNGFRSRVTLDNLTQDIALSIRQIQTSAGAAISGTDPETELPRGIYFPATNGVYEKYFILFEDAGGVAGLYDEGVDVLIDTITIQTPDSIGNIFYGADIGNAENTLNGGSLGIIFQRYKTDAVFADEQNLTEGASVVRIQVISPDGARARMVTVNRLGQVSVQSVSVPENSSMPINPTSGGQPSNNL